MSHDIKAKSLVRSTASAAGGWRSKALTVTRIHLTRLEELVSFQRRLIASGLVARSDEVASARRRLQFLTGPSGLDTLKNELRGGFAQCWRHRSSERQQAKLTLNSLMEGLSNLRKESWRLLKEMKTKLRDPQIRLIERKIRTITRRIRILEKYRIRKKEANIQKTDNDCRRHQICKWVRKVRDQYK